MKKMRNRTATILLCLFLFTSNVHAARLLIPVGQVIGLEIADNRVTVAAFDRDLGQKAQEAGLQVGDRIINIDSIPIQSAADVEKALKQSDGTVTLSVLRGEKNRQLQITPEITDDGPRLGVYLKQGVTGVGTVTWYDSESGTFGVLGHGVNRQNGELLPMQQGRAYPATILSVKKGKSGDPGQLVGALDSATPIGTLYKNTPQGVFGKTQTGWQGELLPIGKPEEIHTGPATIRSTISGEQVQDYSVEILKIYPNVRTNGRNMLLRVTDPNLLTTTGGIVQGMSGSPIIQDGKLIGAVTHVLVNDPTTGYGIFIENMLDAAA